MDKGIFVKSDTTTQQVKLKLILSSSTVCRSGTPQGSVLRSILFIIYVNDLPLAIKYSKIYLYVDYVKLYLPISFHDDIKHLQSNIDSLSSWCKQLFLNLKKCVVLDFVAAIR